jgi:hypothetical protein
MNLQAVSALYRLPASTTIGHLTDGQLNALHEWAMNVKRQTGMPERCDYFHPSMLLSEWMDREVEAAHAGKCFSDGSLN